MVCFLLILLAGAAVGYIFSSPDFGKNLKNDLSGFRVYQEFPSNTEGYSTGYGKQHRISVSRHDAKEALERQNHLRVHILHVAKQLMAGEIGVIAASRELGYLRHEVEPRVAEILVTFAAIDSETDTLPIGKVRKEWHPDALRRKDKEIVEAEQFYRDSATNAAVELIRLLDASS